MNRLGAETSPYLRQHADNPVEWWAWSDEAFAAARERDRPVFLSVGYSSCHWCHVMAHESFEHEATAALMNDLFVNVKVDREERPDVDAIYMDAVQAMTGRGGWPMSVWLTPDGRPFYAGTYFPNNARHGMPSFTDVCVALDEAWRDRRDEIDTQADRLRASLDQSLAQRARSIELPAEPPTLLLERLARTALASFDVRHGGFGGAPKFPPGMLIAFLASHHARTGDTDALAALTSTLDHMAAGGIYDQLGGGFARYSVDDRWLVPHFEKMLYDQALIVRAYVRGYQLTGSPRWQRVVEETVDYVLTTLRHPEGGLFSAEDADSEGEEGRFYVWSLDEITELLGDDAGELTEWFGVTAGGNFEGRNILFERPDAGARPAVLQAGMRRLFDVRAQRVRPGLDDKVLCEWNALFARTLAEAAWVFDRPEWMRAAAEIVGFLLERLRRDDGRLLRSWHADAAPRSGWGSDGRARHLAYAADHATLLQALVTLGTLDDPQWIDEARSTADALVDLFWSEDEGVFTTTGRDAPELIVSTVDLQDNAVPSANSSAATALIRLSRVTGDPELERLARQVLDALIPLAMSHPGSFAQALEAYELAELRPVELVIVGTTEDRSPLERAAARRVLPATTILVASAATESDLPLLAGRLERPDAAAYVCEAGACRLPVSDAVELVRELDAAYELRAQATS